MRRLPAVDLLRSFSILAVLAVHLELQGPHPAPRVLAPLWGHFAGKGALGVSVFFVVSGFLITRALRDGPGGLFSPGLRAFYARRAGRILPPLAAILALGWWLNDGVTRTTPAFRACLNDTGHFLKPSLYASIATFSFNWQRILGEARGFGLHWDVLWSLSIEEQFYLLYPLVLRALKSRRGLAAFLGAWVIAGPAFRAWAASAHPGDFLWIYTASFGCFDQLALGGLLLLARERWGDALDRRPRLSAALAAGGALLGAAAYIAVETSQDLVLAPSLVALGAALFLLGALSWKLEGAAVEALGLPGRLSYEAYLLQGAMLYLLWDVLKPMGAFPAFALWVAAVTAAAWVFSVFFAAPANERVRAFFKAPR